MSESAEQMPAAVLAGGGPDDKVAKAAGAPCKALAEVGGRPLVAWVLDALHGAELVSEIVVVEGPTRPLSEQLSDPVRLATAQGPEVLDTFYAAAEALPESERILCVTADLPLLTSEGIDDFIGSCLRLQAEVSYATVAADEVERAMPGRGKTVSRLREGRFTGGGAACLSRRFILEHGPIIGRVFARRKNPVAMLQMFGWGFLARLALGRLSIADLEKRASERLGCTLRAVISEYPGLAFDVDDADDLELSRRYVGRLTDDKQS